LLNRDLIVCPGNRCCPDDPLDGGGSDRIGVARGIGRFPRLTGREIDEMSTAYDVRYPDDMVRASHGGTDENWAEFAIRSVAESVEDYARSEPLKFAAWVFGIGFILGWKMKPW
jgi:hypothetical protein